MPRPNIWMHSMENDRMHAASKVFFAFSNSAYRSGSSTPSGKNSSTFSAVSMGPLIMSTNGRKLNRGRKPKGRPIPVTARTPERYRQYRSVSKRCAALCVFRFTRRSKNHAPRNGSAGSRIENARPASSRSSSSIAYLAKSRTRMAGRFARLPCSISCQLLVRLTSETRFRGSHDAINSGNRKITR